MMDYESSEEEEDGGTQTPKVELTASPAANILVEDICKKRPYLIKRSDFLNVKLPSIVKFQYSMCVSPAGCTFANPLKCAVMPPEKDLEKMQKKINQSPKSSILLPYGLFSAEGIGKFLYLHTMKKTKVMVLAESDWFSNVLPLHQHEVLEPISEFKLTMFRDFIADNPYKKTMPIAGSVEIMVEDLTSLCCDRLYIDTVIMKYIDMVMNQQNDFQVYYLNGMQADLAQAGREAQANMKNKFVFIMHVKQYVKDGKHLVNMAGVDGQDGNHFTFCVVMLDGITVTALYVDTLGLAAPDTLVQSLKQFFLGYLDNLAETSLTINLHYVHYPTEQTHTCNYNCSVYIKQTCTTVGGPAVLLGVSLVLFCPDEFQKLINLQRADNACISFTSRLGHFLPDISIHAHYLRYCVINWFTSGIVKIENCIGHEQLVVNRFSKIRKPVDCVSDFEIHKVEKEAVINPLINPTRGRFSLRPPRRRKVWSKRQMELQKQVSSSSDESSVGKGPSGIQLIPQKTSKKRVQGKKLPMSNTKGSKTELSDKKVVEDLSGCARIKEENLIVERSLISEDKSSMVVQLSRADMTVSSATTKATLPKQKVEEVVKYHVPEESSTSVEMDVSKKSSAEEPSANQRVAPTSATFITPTPFTATPSAARSPSSMVSPSLCAAVPTPMSVVSPAGLPLKTGIMFTTPEGTFIAPLDDPKAIEALMKQGAGASIEVPRDLNVLPTIMASAAKPAPTPGNSTDTQQSNTNVISIPILKSPTEGNTTLTSVTQGSTGPDIPVLSIPGSVTKTCASPIQIVPSHIPVAVAPSFILSSKAHPADEKRRLTIVKATGKSHACHNNSGTVHVEKEGTALNNSGGSQSRCSGSQDDVTGPVVKGKESLKIGGKTFAPAVLMKTSAGGQIVNMVLNDSTKSMIEAAVNALGRNVDLKCVQSKLKVGKASARNVRMPNILSRNRRASAAKPVTETTDTHSRSQVSHISVGSDQESLDNISEVCDDSVSSASEQNDTPVSQEDLKSAEMVKAVGLKSAEVADKCTEVLEERKKDGSNNDKCESVDKLIQSISDGATAVHKVITSVTEDTTESGVKPSDAEQLGVIPTEPQKMESSTVHIAAKPVSVDSAKFAEKPLSSSTNVEKSTAPRETVLKMSKEMIKMLRDNPNSKVKFADGREIKISWVNNDANLEAQNVATPETEILDREPEPEKPSKYVLNSEYKVEAPAKVLDLLWKHPTVKILLRDDVVLFQLRVTLNVDSDALHTMDFQCEGNDMEATMKSVCEYIQSDDCIRWIQSTKNSYYRMITVPRNLRSFLSVPPVLRFVPPDHLVLTIQVRKQAKVNKAFSCTEAGFDDIDAMREVNQFANTDLIYQWLKEEHNMQLELDIENATCLKDLLSRPYKVRYAEPSTLRLRCNFLNGKVIFKRFPCTSEGLNDANAMAMIEKFVNGAEGLEWAHQNGTYESAGRFEWVEVGELPVGLQTKYFFDEFKFDVLNSVSQSKFVERFCRNSSECKPVKHAAWGMAHRTDEEYRLVNALPEGHEPYQVVTRKVTCAGKSSACRAECGTLLSEVSRDIRQQYCTGCTRMLYTDEEMKTCTNCGLVTGSTKYWGEVHGNLSCGCCYRYFKKHGVLRPNDVKKLGLAGREKLIHPHLACNWRLKLSLYSNDLTKWKVLHGRKNDFYHREEAVQEDKRPSLSQRDFWDQQILAAGHATQTKHLTKKLKSLGDKTVTPQRINCRLKRLKRKLPLSIASGRAAIRKRRNGLPTVEKADVIETEVQWSESEEEAEGQVVEEVVKQEDVNMCEVTVPSVEETHQEEIQTIPQETLATISQAADCENIVILHDHLLCSMCVAQKLHPPFTCSSSAELFRHTSEVHSVRVFSCSLCWNGGNLVSFESEQELTNHCAITHADPQLFSQQTEVTSVKIMRTDEVLNAIDTIATGDEYLVKQEQDDEEQGKKRTNKIDMSSCSKRMCVDGDLVRCSECNEDCGNRAMCCDNCHSWYHWHCISFTKDEDKWYCVRCIPV